MKQLLIVANTPSDNTLALAQATLKGAKHDDITGVETLFLSASEATADHVIGCDAIIIGTTENFGYMSGLIKDFFERIYYPVLEQKQGLPYALYIRAGLDGTGTEIGVQKIISGLKWKQSHERVLLHGEFDSDFQRQCHDLGLYMAASLDAGVI